MILCTLLLADIFLPLLAPKKEDKNAEEQLQLARMAVLEGVIKELRALLEEKPDSEYTPAGRLTLMRYRARLMHQRFVIEGHGSELEQLMKEILDVQQKRADELQSQGYDISEVERMPYYAILPGIRASLGYFGGALHVGSRFETRKGRFLFRIMKHRRQNYEDEKAARVYYDTCIFAIELEHAAIEYLKEIVDSNEGERAEVAALLMEEHEASLHSLWGRINFGQEHHQKDTGVYDHDFLQHHQMPEGMQANTAEQFRMARRYADEVDASALSIELDQIRKMRAEGRITESAARELREQVYLMQTMYLE